MGRSRPKAQNIHIHHAQPQLAASQSAFKPAMMATYFDDVLGEQFQVVRDLGGNINLTSTANRGRVDDPMNFAAVNTTMPAVGQLSEFTMREAALVANLTTRLRALGDTFQLIETTMPELVPQFAPVINAYKQASKRAINKGFDIKQNGLDKKLAKMGLSNSSTAIGAQMALSKEKTDTEIDNVLKTTQLGESLRQQALTNNLELGKQVVQEGIIEMDRYRTESGNQLTARQQDLGRETLVQDNAAKTIAFGLEQRGQDINAELGRRDLQVRMTAARNPIGNTIGLLNDTNHQALSAIQGDNQARNNATANQINHQNANVARFQAEQAAQSNPLLEIATTGVGAFVGKYAGSMGLQAANNKRRV